jgi:hypothetical protein
VWHRYPRTPSLEYAGNLNCSRMKCWEYKQTVKGIKSSITIHCVSLPSTALVFWQLNLTGKNSVGNKTTPLHALMHMLMEFNRCSVEVSACGLLLPWSLHNSFMHLRWGEYLLKAKWTGLMLQPLWPGFLIWMIQ